MTLLTRIKGSMRGLFRKASTMANFCWKLHCSRAVDTCSGWLTVQCPPDGAASTGMR